MGGLVNKDGKGWDLQQSKFEITVDPGLESDLDLEVEVEPEAKGIALATAALLLVLQSAARDVAQRARGAVD